MTIEELNNKVDSLIAETNKKMHDLLKSIMKIMKITKLIPLI